MVIKKVRNLLRSYSFNRQRWYPVLGEKRDSVRFNACFGRSANSFAQEEKFVDVVGHGGMPVSRMVAIEDRGKLPGYDIITRLLLDFADSGQARAVANIGPPSRKSPATVAAFSNQQ